MVQNKGVRGRKKRRGEGERKAVGQGGGSGGEYAAGVLLRRRCVRFVMGVPGSWGWRAERIHFVFKVDTGALHHVAADAAAAAVVAAAAKL